jgi:hypothetical protein
MARQVKVNTYTGNPASPACLNHQGEPSQIFSEAKTPRKGPVHFHSPGMLLRIMYIKLNHAFPNGV